MGKMGRMLYEKNKNFISQVKIEVWKNRKKEGNLYNPILEVKLYIFYTVYFALYFESKSLNLSKMNIL